MGFLSSLFGSKPYPPQARREVQALLEELIKIGHMDDFLSEHPGGAFNMQCRHIRTRQIGKRLDEIGGYPLMQYAYEQVRKKAGKQLASHLEYAWEEVGSWQH